MENSMEFSPKTKNRTTKRSRNSTARYISEKNKYSSSKRYMYSNVHNSIIYNIQDKEATQVSTNRITNKEIVVCTHTHTHTHTHKNTIWNITHSLKGIKFCHLQKHG